MEELKGFHLFICSVRPPLLFSSMNGWSSSGRLLSAKTEGVREAPSGW